jgi:hypothetical protein
VQIKTMCEEIERHDWNIDHKNDTYNEQKQKSISAYYVDNWYNKLIDKDITFLTYFYSHDNLPEKLPFEKCMVRWENKSPKDSEYWGPVSTKNEALRLFNTSLRCHKNKGKIICVREWNENIKNEFRCFWNEKLRVICPENTKPNYEPNYKILLDWIKNNAENIIFYRCIFDVCEMHDGTYKLIEFNSWETNSRTSNCDWYDNTELLYDNTMNKNIVTFMWGNNDKKINYPDINFTKIIHPQNEITVLLHDINPKDFKIISEDNDHFIVNENSFFLTNDIYIGKFSLNSNNFLQPLCWHRSKNTYRFSYIKKILDGLTVYDNSDDTYLTQYLYEIRQNEFSNEICIHNSERKIIKSFNKYGFLCEIKGVKHEIILDHNCELKIVCHEN